jgi:hypothetical protein
MKKLIPLIILTAVLVGLGCTGYEYKPVPFKSAEAYPNHQVVFGAVIAAKAWTDNAEAASAFGFNIRGAGLTPVQVVVDNKGPNSLTIVPDQTLLVDSEKNMWNLLPAEVAYERIDRNVAVSRMGGKGAKTAVLGGIAGGILGAAVGIVAGGDVGEAAMRGAAAGAAVGAVKGGYEGLEDPRSKQVIADDLRTKGLKDKPMKPYEISHGFLFFPGEIKDASLLRLKIKNMNSGQVQILELPVQK